jgi:hypothetical protein
MGDDLPPDDEELSVYLAQRRAEGLDTDYDPVEVGPPQTNNNIGASGLRQALINSHFT